MASKPKKPETRGGYRPGSGRPKLPAEKRAPRAPRHGRSKTGIDPLDVMLATMRHHWKKAIGGTNAPSLSSRDNKIKDEASALMAAQLAKDIAPYRHPRLSSIEASGPGGDAIPVEIGGTPELIQQIAKIAGRGAKKDAGG